MTEGKNLPIWVIYNHPKDYPDKYVARKFILDKPTSEIAVGNTLDEVRLAIPKGLFCIKRNPTDDPNIVESWL